MGAWKIIPVQFLMSFQSSPTNSSLAGLAEGSLDLAVPWRPSGLLFL